MRCLKTPFSLMMVMTTIKINIDINCAFGNAINSICGMIVK